MQAMHATSGLLVSLVLLLAACQTGKEAEKQERDVHYLVTQGRYRDAVRVAQEQHERRANPESETNYRMATVAFLLARGRQETLRDEDVRALDTFSEAYVLDPEAPEVLEWIDKTSDKLARFWFETARDAHTEDDLPAALEAYEKVLEYDPDHADSAAGILRVGRQLQYRDGLAQDYYNEGLAALHDYQLRLAVSRFSYSSKYRHWDEKPRKRVREVNSEISLELTDRALQLESDGYYAAAQTEFRLAKGLDPDNPHALDGLERMRVEAEAGALMRKGEMWLLRGEWDKARQVLEEGRELSQVQHDRFDDILGTIEDARINAMYQHGLNLERDFRLDEAVVAFEALLQERDFYEDARARLTDLQATVEEVQGLYQSLAAGGTKPADELGVLRRIEFLWPDYQDVPERMEALEE